MLATSKRVETKKIGINGRKIVGNKIDNNAKGKSFLASSIERVSLRPYNPYAFKSRSSISKSLHLPDSKRRLEVLEQVLAVKKDRFYHIEIIFSGEVPSLENIVFWLEFKSAEGFEPCSTVGQKEYVQVIDAWIDNTVEDSVSMSGSMTSTDDFEMEEEGEDQDFSTMRRRAKQKKKESIYRVDSNLSQTSSNMEPEYVVHLVVNFPMPERGYITPSEEARASKTSGIGLFRCVVETHWKYHEHGELKSLCQAGHFLFLVNNRRLPRQLGELLKEKSNLDCILDTYPQEVRHLLKYEYSSMSSMASTLMSSSGSSSNHPDPSSRAGRQTLEKLELNPNIYNNSYLGKYIGNSDDDSDVSESSTNGSNYFYNNNFHGDLNLSRHASAESNVESNVAGNKRIFQYTKPSTTVSDNIEIISREPIKYVPIKPNKRATVVNSLFSCFGL